MMHWFRPFNLFLLCIFQFILIINLHESNSHFNIWSYLLIALPTVLTAAAGYFINNIFDKDIDAVNKPTQEPMPEVLSKNHLKIYFSLNILAIVISILTYKIGFILVVVFTQILLYFYSSTFKKKYIWGNLIVSLLSALSIISLIFYDNQILVYHVMFFAIFSFLITFIREIIKDMEDEEGDKTFGAETIPIKKGIGTSKNIAQVLTMVLVFCMLYYLFELIIHAQIIAAIWFIVFALIPVIVLYVFIHKAGNKKQFSQVSLYCKYTMVSAITTTFFIVGNATGL